MAYPRRKFVRRAAKKGFKRVMPPRFVRPASGAQIVSYKRTSLPENLALVAGAGGFRVPITLNQIYTTDIIAAYDMYRIKRVTLRLIPQVDPGSSLVVTGTTFAQNQEAWVVAACDPADEAISVPTIAIVSKFNNYKLDTIRAGKEYNYYFYPKVSNIVTGSSGTTKGSGTYGKYNPWLRLDADGITIPHYNVICGLQTSFGTSTANYTYTFTVEFDCMLTR